MNRINRLFNEKKKDILSIYFCAGHPAPDSTAETIRALADAGVDMVEVGIPFSDPIADGKVIQDAATKALRGGMTLRKLFDQLADIRRDVDIPLILMGYLNPIMRMGFEEFCRRCAETGIDGAIIPDLPYRDYMESYKATADRYGLKIIMLITPETGEERIRRIDNDTDGFIYMVSSAATTGARDSFDSPTLEYFRRVDGMHLRNPRMIGFGIGNRQTLRAAMDVAAGAIVGSKFVSLLDERRDSRAAVAALLEVLGR